MRGCGTMFALSSSESRSLGARTIGSEVPFAAHYRSSACRPNFPKLSVFGKAFQDLGPIMPRPTGSKE
jgi:hypothetical protein